MISLGPVPMLALLAFLALTVAILLARRLAPREPDNLRKHAVSVMLDMATVGFIAARLGFVALSPTAYMSDPAAIVRIGDGGFSLWIGVLIALMFGAWRTRHVVALRRPLAAGVLAGLMAWFAASATLTLLQRSSVPLPDANLITMDGYPIRLSDMSGKPIVVNLWAAWCPPCRREMPALAAAQKANPEVMFVFVNQGEAADTIHAYLKDVGLTLQNVMRDPHSAVMNQSGTRGLPTTLIFDQHGRLVDSHMGELNATTLDRKLQRVVTAP